MKNLPLKDIINLLKRYEKATIELNDHNRWRGRKDKNYPEIEQEYQQAVGNADAILDQIESKINDYIDKRIDEKLTTNS